MEPELCFKVPPAAKPERSQAFSGAYLDEAESGSIGSASRGPVGTGSITVNSGATLDVNTTLIHNTKTNNGSIVNKPTPTFTFSNNSKSAT